jgi:hypothetical protein
MGLKDRLQQDLKEALRNRDERRKAVIRMALAAIQLAEADHGGELDESSLIAVLQKEVKRRQETIEELRGDLPGRPAGRRGSGTGHPGILPSPDAEPGGDCRRGPCGHRPGGGHQPPGYGRRDAGPDAPDEGARRRSAGQRGRAGVVDQIRCYIASPRESKRKKRPRWGSLFGHMEVQR